MNKYSEDFLKTLDLLDLSYDPKSNTSLLFVNNQSSRLLAPGEIFALETAAIYGADAVYFRHFSDERNIQPQIYLYDNTNRKLNADEIANLQRALWSSGAVPLFLIIENSQMLVFDSRKPVDANFFNKIIASPIEVLQLSSDAIKAYSAKYFDNGSFWDQEQNADRYLVGTSAYIDLIEGLRRIRKSFLTQANLPDSTTHKLLVLSILIKYLEERGDDGETLFAKNFFKQFGADDFCGVLRKIGKVISLFSKLAEHFNGKIFEWNDPLEIELLHKADLSTLADYLDGNVENSQYVIWRKYSFKHLPVELISNVYEEFLGRTSKGVFYTPHFLVNTLIDECMPANQPKRNFKFADVSCGSGVFLVAGFKRLVEWNRYEEYLNIGKLPSTPPLKDLKKLLRSSVFGVDIEAESTRLAIFSLSLALCDMLTPKQIWTELKFDDLSQNNIHTGDFFEYVLENKNHPQFDLIIGNPPFNELNRDVFDSLISNFDIEPICRIPQNQIALLFLDQAARLLLNNGKICMIMPSGPLLYNNTLEFRKAFWSKYHVSQILDFTNLSATLFGNASVATCAIFAENKLPDDKDILHITVRRTKSSKEKIFFEIDHYDFHYVSQEDSLINRYAWKANLLGGVRVTRLLDRLMESRKLIDFLHDKKEKNGWDFGQGYIVGQKNSKLSASYITGQPTVIDRYFTEDGIGKVEIQIENSFKDKSREQLFKPPHLLIKKSIGNKKIPVVMSNEYLTFKNEILGVYAPLKEADQLRQIKSYFDLNSRTLRFLISVTSSRAGISRSIKTLLLQDITNLPYPSKHEDLQLSYAEQIIQDDVLDYYLEQISKGENASVNKVAGIDEIQDFCKVFCEALNSIYGNESSQFNVENISETLTYYIVKFAYGGISEAAAYEFKLGDDSAIETLLVNETGKNVRINRVLKIYQRDTIYLVKPKSLRYWLKSVALRDADESFDDLYKAGY